jgi:magnesium transporter
LFVLVSIGGGAWGLVMSEASSMAARLASLHPRDTARFLEMGQPDEAVVFLEGLEEDDVAPIVDGMTPGFAAQVLAAMEAARRDAVLAEMDPPCALAALHEMPEHEREAISQALDAVVAQRIAHAQTYPADTAGGMMLREFVTLTDDLTVEGAIARLRRAPRQQLHYLYVVDARGMLAGVLPMRELLSARARQPIEELLVRPAISVRTDAPRQRVLQLMEERELLGLPVVDRQDRLVGVVTPAQAIAAGEAFGMEKLQMAVGAGTDESALSPVRYVIKRRLPWLMVNLVTAFSAAAVVGLFEGIIAKVTALAVLLPVVSGQGGNAGSQSLAIVMRGLALREILPGMTRRVIFKEVVAGSINGVAIAIVTGLAVYVWSRSWALGVVIGVAMIVNMGAAALAGAIIPVILQALGRDPAAASAIILTTVTDIVGFASFLGFAMVMTRFVAL